jgi:UDP-glucose 4-epimerase
MGLKWLITGGCGFIGSRLIQTLKTESGHSIRVLDDLSTGTREDLALVTDFKEKNLDELSDNCSDVELFVGDILDESIIRSVSNGIDVIVHLAANTGVGPSVEDPKSDCMTNVLGTFNVLEAARFNKVRRFIFASSGAPVGEVTPPIHEEIAPHPVSPYGASKLSGEGYCSAYFKTYGIETVVLRFGNVYGPGSLHKNSVVAKFIKQALNGETLEIYGDGSQTRDFIYIDDLINAIKLAAEVPGVGGEIFQIASNRETTIHELTNELVDELHKFGIDRFSVKYGDERLGDVKRNFSDTQKASKRLGWKSSTSRHVGIKNTIEYFIK